MNIKNYLLIILILINLVLIITSLNFIKSIGELESRLVQIEEEVRNPEVKIIPVK